MEECEAVCDRLTIMVSGVMRCIGSVQHLKKRYAQGFSLLLRIIDSPEADARLEDLKQHVKKVFTSYHTILKDEHVVCNHNVLILNDGRFRPERANQMAVYN